MGDPPREGAKLAVHLGELGAQLNIESVELGGRRGVNELKVDQAVGRVERHGDWLTSGRKRGLGRQ
eukprot:11166083-Alexandrium_andersonii.AAC.1